MPQAVEEFYIGLVDVLKKDASKKCRWCVASVRFRTRLVLSTSKSARIIAK